MRAAIEMELGKIKGLKLQYAGRASNLFWLGFGEMVQIIRRGQIEEIAEYALHIQCSWRITSDNKIVIAARDFYSPNSKWDGLIEDFDWDIQGNNRFDERIKSFINDNEPIIVEEIEVDDIGGFSVILSSAYKLETFPDSSEEDEHWRFFNSKEKSPHFVVSGEGIERI
ncbi:hypothetical protein [Metabacillus sp. SLBN-84]